MTITLNAYDRDKLVSLLQWMSDHGGGSDHPIGEPREGCPSCHASYLYSVIVTQRNLP